MLSYPKRRLGKLVLLFYLAHHVSLLLHFLVYSELQENLIRSHAAGVGTPLSPQQTRRMMALRLNVLLKGFRYT